MRLALGSTMFQRVYRSSFPNLQAKNPGLLTFKKDLGG